MFLIRQLWDGRPQLFRGASNVLVDRPSDLLRLSGTKLLPDVLEPPWTRGESAGEIKDRDRVGEVGPHNAGGEASSVVLLCRCPNTGVIRMGETAPLLRSSVATGGTVGGSEMSEPVSEPKATRLTLCRVTL
jgi:hypothetical protein